MVLRLSQLRRPARRLARQERPLPFVCGLAIITIDFSAPAI